MLKINSKEAIGIFIALALYGFGVFVMGIAAISLLAMIAPLCIFAVFAFRRGEPKQCNQADNTLGLFWLAIYIALVALTAKGMLPLVNEFSNWLWLVVIPLAAVKISNKATVKETLGIVGLCGEATKQPWKKKTALMCLMLAPFLIWAAHARFNITFGSIMESPATLLLFPVMFLLMMLTAGSTEEIFFRGIVQRNIYNAAKSQVIAVLASALLFALFHFPWAYFSWPHTQGNALLSAANIMTEQFVSGVFLGIVFIRSSNLWTVIVLHSFINSVWATATFFTDSPILRFG